MIHALIALIIYGNQITITQTEAENWRLDELAWKYAACESGHVPDIKKLDSNNKFSYGMLQFQEDTFNEWGKVCGLPHSDLESYEQARDIFKCMYKRGVVKDHWKICFKKLNS